MLRYAVFMVCLTGLTQTLKLTSEEKNKMIEVMEYCIKETGVDTATLDKARDGEYSNDPKLISLALCFHKKTGFQNEKGDIQLDVIKDKLKGRFGDDKTMEEAIGNCAVQKSSPEETAYEMMKCFSNYLPDKELMK